MLLGGIAYFSGNRITQLSSTAYKGDKENLVNCLTLGALEQQSKFVRFSA